MTNYKQTKIPKFRRFVLQNFPFIEQDFDALTDYQLICKVVEYLNKVITSQNALIDEMESYEITMNGKFDRLEELFNQLHDYVENYFDNLDVQEEINNKLDAMVEAGTLQEIVADYLNSKALFGYDTVDDMKSATNLIDGSYAKTLGYYNINDGGGAVYKILSTEPTGEYITLDSGLYAKLICNEVILTQFGAKGDGTTDDTLTIQRAIQYAKTNNLSVTSPKNKIYLINQTIDVSNLNIDLNFATIKAGSAISILKVESTSYYTNIKNIMLDADSIATKCIDIVEGRKCYLDNLNLINVTNTGIHFESGYEIYANNINITGTEYGTSSVGLLLDSGDSYWSNFVIIDIHTAIYQRRQTLHFYNGIHAWLLHSSLVNGSCMFKFYGNCKAELNNCYSDTYLYTFYLELGSPSLMISNLKVIYATFVMTPETMVNIDPPHLFYIDPNNGDETDGLIRVCNLDFTGLKLDGVDIVNKLSNKDFFNGELTNVLGKYIDKDISYNKINTSNRSADITAVSETLEKVSNIGFYNGIYTASNVDDTNRVFTIGKLPYYFLPKESINTSCRFGTNEYGQTQSGYLYVNANNGLITVTLPTGLTGTQYIKINLSYLITNMY